MANGFIKLPGLKDMVNLYAPIIPGGSFTWLEALKAGERIPTDENVTAGIIKLARALEPFRKRLGKPLIITSWYRTPEANAAAGGVSNSTHLTGKGLDCYCEKLETGFLYDWFDGDWQGGLGWYSTHIHLDVGDRRRW